MHAAHTAQALGVAAQAVIPQLHVPVRAHGHVHNLPVPGDVQGNFPVHGGGEGRQQLHQLPRKKGILLHLILIQPLQICDQRVPHARQVAMHFLLHAIPFRGQT